jgi:Chaperone of endosialidase
MDTDSAAILSLKPVTFHYNGDQTNTAQFGLIAEEVEESESRSGGPG